MHPEKSTIINNLSDRLGKSAFLILTDYTGVTVPDFDLLRNKLEEVGSKCTVIKNTYLRIAAEKAGLPELGDLTGQTAIVTGDRDFPATAKIVKTFASDKKKMSVKVGISDKDKLTIEQFNQIADLPARDVLLATLLRLLQEPASSLARVLQAKVDKENGGAPAPEPAPEGGEAAA